MLTVIGEHTIKNWQKSGAYEFRLYADESFFASNGTEIPAGRPGSLDAYQKIGCIYNAAAKTITVPILSVEKTDTSLDKPDARYSVAGIYSRNVLVHTILRDFTVPASLGNSVTWVQLAINSQPARRSFDLLGEIYTKSQVNALVANVVAGGGNGVDLSAFSISNYVPTYNLDANTADEENLLNFICTLVSVINGAGGGGGTGTSAPVASTTQSGTVQIATQVEVNAGTDTLKVLTPSTFAASANRIRKFAIDIGNGTATSFTITHNLNSRDVSTAIYLNSGTYDEVLCDVQHTTLNTATLVFATAPALNAYRCVVIG